MELRDRGKPESLGSLGILEAFVDIQVMGDLWHLKTMRHCLEAFGDLGTLEVQRSDI